jgi:hypothetical protein
MVVSYFKDGECLEIEVNITEEELLGALPLIMPKILSREQLDRFVSSIRDILLIKKVYNFVNF